MHKATQVPSPLVQLINETVRLAGLFHDLGKTMASFQLKITPDKSGKPKPDYLRHEYVSYQMVLNALSGTPVAVLSDRDWLQHWSAAEQVRQVFEQSYAPGISEQRDLMMIQSNEAITTAFPVLTALLFLIISHHKLPTHADESNGELQVKTLASLFVNELVVAKAQRQRSMVPAKGKTPVWDAQYDWAHLVADCCQTIHQLLERHAIDLGTLNHRAWFTLFSTQARGALILADHSVSADKRPARQPAPTAFYANSFYDQETDKFYFAQTLVEHLERVGHDGRLVANMMATMQENGIVPVITVDDYPSMLKRAVPADSPFAWQDDAVGKLKQANITGGFFGLMIAKTGAGKTIGYTKCMSAFGDLRFNLSLGLRSLTLQSGDAYREDIGFNQAQVACLIGSQIARQLHEANRREALSDAVGTDNALADDLEDMALIGGNESLDIKALKALKPKVRQMIQTPLLISTVDHLIPTVDGRRTTQTALHLRLMSSDLILDEIDAYSEADLVVLARLVYQTAFYGRKVMLSSATLPPAIAEGLFAAYEEGYRDYCRIHDKPFSIHSAWLSHDVDVTQVHDTDDLAAFKARHTGITASLIAQMDHESIKRCVDLVPIAATIRDCATVGTMFPAFATIQAEADRMHQRWGLKDPVSGKAVSIGVIRFATVGHCREFVRYALDAQQNAADGVGRYYLCYHAKHAPLALNAQEKLLNVLLKGHDDPSKRALFKHPAAREIIDGRGAAYDSIELTIATTSIEEVGRDHDFDWGMMDPSATRSVVQMGGRIRRHRMPPAYLVANLALFDTPLRSVQNALSSERKAPAFSFPGIESHPNYKLGTMFTSQVYDIRAWRKRLDARHMLAESGLERSAITKLEHQAYRAQLDSEATGTPVQDYLNDLNNRIHDKHPYLYEFRQTDDEAILVYYHAGEQGFYRLYQDGAEAELRPCDRMLIREQAVPTTHLILSIDYNTLLATTDVMDDANDDYRYQALLSYEARYSKKNQDRYTKRVLFEDNLGFQEKKEWH